MNFCGLASVTGQPGQPVATAARGAIPLAAGPDTPGEHVGHHETGVVPVARVSRARVAEPGHQPAVIGHAVLRDAPPPRAGAGPAGGSQSDGASAAASGCSPPSAAGAPASGTAPGTAWPRLRPRAARARLPSARPWAPRSRAGPGSRAPPRATTPSGSWRSAGVHRRADLHALDVHLDARRDVGGLGLHGDLHQLLVEQPVGGHIAGRPWTGMSTVTFSPRRTMIRSTCSTEPLIASRWTALGRASWLPPGRPSSRISTFAVRSASRTSWPGRLTCLGSVP